MRTIACTESGVVGGTGRYEMKGPGYGHLVSGGDYGLRPIPLLTLSLLTLLDSNFLGNPLWT